uniref:Zinc transporter ZIP3 n=1 Tax=Rhabditophanes sp. KR3021 TaxID=114890 RepID=A0AC35UDY8_9BILA
MVGESNFGLQTSLIFGLLIVTAVAGLIPLYLVHKTKSKVRTARSVLMRDKILSMLSCYGGGVFYAVCFLDIFPHIDKKYAEFKELSEYNSDLPVTQLLLCFGFFLVYFLEEVSVKCLGNSHSHNHVSIDIVKDQKSPANPFIESSRRQSLISMERKLSSHLAKAIADGEKDDISVDEAKTSMFKSIIFAIIMSFHSILEGVALGVKDDMSAMWMLFISLLIHKGIESFSVGLHVSKTNASKIKMIVITIVVYAFMTPIGAGIGIILQNLPMSEVVRVGIILVLECLAGGTFIYVTFLELIANERANPHDNVQQLLSISAGFITITVLQIYAHGNH